jgi:hypothetical protein
LGDNSTSGSYITTYETSNVFTLDESNVIAITDVYVNDASSGVTHSYSSTSNKVTISSSLTAGATIQIDYTYYPNYSNTELTGYIQAALINLSLNNYYTFKYDSTTDAIYPEPSDQQRNLIAVVTSLIIDKPINALRLSDITINFPSDEPLDAKISRAISHFKHDTHGIFGVIGNDDMGDVNNG